MQIRQRLDKILDRIQEASFLENKGLGNEIGFYIFDYDPKHEMLVRQHIQYLISKVNHAASDRHIIEFDLYQLLIDLLKQEGLLDQVASIEKTEGPQYIREALRDMARPDAYIAMIKRNVTDNHIIFLTGIGKVWPIVRSHSILNSLHPILDDRPVIMFFPGRYDGSELRLFNLMQDEHYYRAFQLIPYKADGWG